MMLYYIYKLLNADVLDGNTKWLRIMSQIKVVNKIFIIYKTLTYKQFPFREMKQNKT